MADDLDQAVQELLAAQHDYGLLRAAIDPPLAKATQRRETAMREAAGHGLSRRAIAQMTGMSHTRVIQILEGQSRRAETMDELSGLSGEALADKLLSLVYSNSLSREEMAYATAMSVENVNTLIREHAERLARQRHEAAVQLVKRHMPPGWTPDAE